MSLIAGLTCRFKTFILVWLQCSSLLDCDNFREFVEEISDEYEEIRDEHYDSLKVVF
jgi:hypothetical protein